MMNRKKIELSTILDYTSWKPDGKELTPEEAVPVLLKEIERLREVNVMQARWLHEAHENHKLFKDKVRQLLSVESVALKDGE